MTSGVELDGFDAFAADRQDRLWHGRLAHAFAAIAASGCAEHGRDVHVTDRVGRCVRTHGGRRRGGFTLVEVLAAILLIAIVLPAVMKGISAASSIAGNVRHKSEAVSLAQSKLNELLATGEWEASGGGSFAPDWPDYSWTSTVSSWDQDDQGTGLEMVEVRVMWTARGQEQFVSLSSLARSDQ